MNASFTSICRKGMAWVCPCPLSLSSHAHRKGYTPCRSKCHTKTNVQVGEKKKKVVKCQTPPPAQMLQGREGRRVQGQGGAYIFHPAVHRRRSSWGLSQQQKRVQWQNAVYKARRKAWHKRKNARMRARARAQKQERRKQKRVRKYTHKSNGRHKQEYRVG